MENHPLWGTTAHALASRGKRRGGHQNPVRELWGVGCSLCERDRTRHDAPGGAGALGLGSIWLHAQSSCLYPVPPTPQPPTGGPQGSCRHGVLWGHRATWKRVQRESGWTNRISVIMPHTRRQRHRRKRRSEGRTERSGQPSKTNGLKPTLSFLCSPTTPLFPVMTNCVPSESYHLYAASATCHILSLWVPSQGPRSKAGSSGELAGSPYALLYFILF